MGVSAVVRSLLLGVVVLLGTAGGALTGDSSSGWSVVAAAGQSVSLDSVAALAPSDVWAAGWRYDSTFGVYRPATEHWNGRSWTFFKAPSATRGYNAFNAIGGTSATDAWA